jgi:hypothetical protein
MQNVHMFSDRPKWCIIPLPRGFGNEDSLLWRDPQAAGRIAVNHHFGLKSLVLLIGILISQLRKLPHLLQQSRSPRIQIH